MKNFDVTEVLAGIDPARCSYQEWLQVGMALKEDGADASVWDNWSARDPARYHQGECQRKWKGFSASGGIGGGTLYHLAQAQGWRPPESAGHELSWDAVIGDGVIIDQHWLEARELPGAEDFHPARQLIRYLETLFEASETVGYVTETWEKDGRFLPAKGAYDRTAGELIEALSSCGDDIGSVLGDYNPRAGAWIRFNPLDGRGVKNENVTEYRYALVESDQMELERQYATIQELQLPVAMLVHSGGRSLHAIVRIDAADYGEYRKRVDHLYSVCEKNGFRVDSQNRNPSRLSRMPGALRNGNKQYIVASNIGKRNYEEWKEWFDGIDDDLPDPVSLADVWHNMPPLNPPLIDGVLRQGHKLLLAGPSKAGKSYALIELCIAIAEGRRWMGWQCARGKVLYVNLELDPASCDNRFRDVYNAMNAPPVNYRDVEIWHLRGKAIPMDKLAPKLIRRARQKGYIAVIIDPIYKVITGDENSAEQMARFCNYFDTLCAELGCAVIYCHHHSKGAQGGKRSMDRASGSGVFARDPDAMLDMIELEITGELRKFIMDKAALKVVTDTLDRYDEDGAGHVLSQDDLQSLCQARAKAEQLLSPERTCEMHAQIARARHAAAQRSAWRIEGTLREFERFPPVNVWFDYPVHRLDAEGFLSDMQAEGDIPRGGWGKKAARKADPEKEAAAKRAAFENAVASFEKPPSAQQLAEVTGKSKPTIARMAKQYGYSYSQDAGGYVKTD